MPATLLVAGTVLTGPAYAADATIPSCEQAGPCVVVEVLDGTSRDRPLQYFYADKIRDQGDVSDTSYPVSGGTDAVVAKGTSVSRLVGLVGLDLGQVTYAEVVWPDAYGRHLLTGDEVRNGFPGDLKPVFYSTDPASEAPTYWNYVRPQRSPDDANGAPGRDKGTFTTVAGGAILVRLHLTGDVLDFDVTATPVAGSDRHYTLSADATGTGLTYDWLLPDQSRSTQASPDFTFPDSALAGTYPVEVGVERDDGSFGWGSASVRAGPAPSAAPTPSATPSGTGGNGPGDAGPTKNPTATLTAEPNPNPSGSTEAPLPTQAPPTPSPTPTNEPTNQPTDEPTEEPTVTPPPVANGAGVTGILLTAAEPVSAGGVLSDAPRPSPAARPISTPPLTLPAALLVVLGALALLGLGAASESGAVRRRVRAWLRMGP